MAASAPKTTRKGDEAMSERKFSLLILPTALLLGICIGALVGRSKCRAEQKRWDDAWYQAHPVVKEVPPKFTFDGAGIASECIVLGNDRLYCNFTKGVGFTPAPPKKAKPAKRRKAGLPIPVCAQHYDDGKTEFACCQPAKANCSMPLNHGTATVYWPPREDGKCYPQDSPFQP